MRWIFATKLRYADTVTYGNGHGWPRPPGQYASDSLAGDASGAAIKLEAPQVKGLKVPQFELAQDTHARITERSQIARQQEVRLVARWPIGNEKAASADSAVAPVLTWTRCRVSLFIMLL
jgi:hypothetical protein